MTLDDILAKRSMRDRFRKMFPVPRQHMDSLMCAQPLSDRHGTVRPAFVHVMRFYIQRMFPKAVQDEWKAQLAVNLIRKNAVTREWAEAVMPAADILRKADKEHQRFIKTGDIRGGLMRSALHLVFLDAIFHTGALGLLGYDRRDMNLDAKDLANMLRVAQNSGHFQPERAVFLDVAFRRCPKALGSISADMVIDGTIIDIRTDSDLKLTQDMYNRALAHHALSARDGRFGAQAVGIYFARYGVLKTFTVEGMDTSTILGWLNK